MTLTVNLACLKSSTTESQQLQYFKLVFLVILNVPIRMVFAETVTYFHLYIITGLHAPKFICVYFKGTCSKSPLAAISAGYVYH